MAAPTTAPIMTNTAVDTALPFLGFESIGK
jgi:hypothetical protein